jgi:hypothetical protein
MPVIRCTQKLLTEIKPAGVDDSPSCDLPLDEWYANVVVLHRQKYVVFINPTTRFVAVSDGKRRNQLQPLQPVFIESLRQALSAEQVDIAVIDRVVQRFEQAQLAKTIDRQTLGCLNDVIRQLKWLRESQASEVRTKDVTKILNRIPWVHTSFGYALIPMEHILRESFGWSERFEP